MADFWLPAPPSDTYRGAGPRHGSTIDTEAWESYPTLPCAEDLTRALGGHWHGSYGMACCPAHDNTRTPALSIRPGGDGFPRLHCFAGCAPRDVAEACAAGGHSGPQRPSVDREAAAIAAAKEVSRKARQAAETWGMASDLMGTPVEAYLRSRGITALPESIRFAPSCWHISGRRYPAMIAKVSGVERSAIHRTYLGLPPGVEPRKAMLGATKGGHILLRTGDPGHLVVGEGIENTLSFAAIYGRDGATLWAALSAGGMASLTLPQAPTGGGLLVVAPDQDAVGLAAGAALKARAKSCGWIVKTAVMRGWGGEVVDWNDRLVAERKKEMSENISMAEINEILWAALDVDEARIEVSEVLGEDGARISIVGDKMQDIASYDARKGKKRFTVADGFQTHIEVRKAKDAITLSGGRASESNQSAFRTIREDAVQCFRPSILDLCNDTDSIDYDEIENWQYLMGKARQTMNMRGTIAFMTEVHDARCKAGTHPRWGYPWGYKRGADILSNVEAVILENIKITPGLFDDLVPDRRTKANISDMKSHQAGTYFISGKYLEAEFGPTKSLLDGED